jgi:hypothetical protein
MKPLLIGDMPTRSTDRYWETPLSGRAAQAMCQIAGFPPELVDGHFEPWTEALYKRFDCVNAIERYEKWSLEKATERLKDLIEPERETVVLIGPRVREAYCAMTYPAESNVSSYSDYIWVLDELSPSSRRGVVVISHPRVVADNQRWKIGLVLREAIENSKKLEETAL